MSPHRAPNVWPCSWQQELELATIEHSSSAALPLGRWFRAQCEQWLTVTAIGEPSETERHLAALQRGLGEVTVFVLVVCPCIVVSFRSRPQPLPP
jgi:hypothetical protein